jgi:hypothetical protein
MNYGNYNGFGNGTEIRSSILAAYDDGDIGFSLGTNFWKGTNGMEVFDQRTGVIGYRDGDFSLRYENDGGLPIKNLGLGDKEDRFRTASLQFFIKDYSAGIQLFTGDRNQDKEIKIKSVNKRGKIKYSNEEFNPQKRGAYNRRFKYGFVEEVGEPYRLGALTVGYKGFKIGTNSEHVRHAIQNRFIHNAIGDRGFKNMSWDWKTYAKYTTPNIFTSW